MDIVAIVVGLAVLGFIVNKMTDGKLVDFFTKMFR